MKSRSDEVLNYKAPNLRSGRTGTALTEQFDYRACGSARGLPDRCFRQKLVGYFSENMLLRLAVPRTQWPA